MLIIFSIFAIFENCGHLTAKESLGTEEVARGNRRAVVVFQFECRSDSLVVFEDEPDLTFCVWFAAEVGQQTRGVKKNRKLQPFCGEFDIHVRLS